MITHERRLSNLLIHKVIISLIAWLTAWLTDWLAESEDHLIAITYNSRKQGHTKIQGDAIHNEQAEWGIRTYYLVPTYLTIINDFNLNSIDYEDGPECHIYGTYLAEVLPFLFFYPMWTDKNSDVVHVFFLVFFFHFFPSETKIEYGILDLFLFRFFSETKHWKAKSPFSY